jgi:acyl-CoA thioester hydrolase
MSTNDAFSPREALIVSPLMPIEPDWIDYNGHLNMAYYNVLFDRAYDGVCEVLGLGPDYAKLRKHTTYTGEIHLRYLREIHLNHLVYGTFQLIDFNEKSMHMYQELHHKDGWLAATCEGIGLHVDMAGPKVAPYPEDIYHNIQNLAKQQSVLARPEGIGRKIGIRRKAG